MTEKRHLPEIIERIKKLKNMSSDNAVAQMLGLSRSALSERKRSASVPYEELDRFAEQENISLDWLLTGKGTMERPGYQQKEGTSLKVGEEIAIYNEIERIEGRLGEIKKSLKPTDITDDEMRWLMIYRRARELSPERLEILESLLKTLRLLPEEEELWLKKRA